MEADWTYLDFLNAASNRLEMATAAKRVFNADGEISSILKPLNWSIASSIMIVKTVFLVYCIRRHRN